MRSSILIFLALGAVACGGGQAPTAAPQSPDAGTVTTQSHVIWPVSNGTVTAYRFDGAVRGAAIGTSQTDDSGAFDLKLDAPATGPLLVAVSSGAYIEPATGTPVLVQGYELTTVVASKVRATGESVPAVVVSPISHLATQLVPKFVGAGATVDAAFLQAQTLLNSHFAGIDWSSVSPPDLAGNDAGSVVQINDSAKAALVLAGFSAEARNLAQAKRLTAGGPLNSLSLLSAIAADLNADGLFDGFGPAGSRLSVPPSGTNAYVLDGQTVRTTLAQGISSFLSSSRNGSQIALTDAQPTMNAIAADANPLLFRDQGGSIDLLPPTIQFVQPVANASVQGQVIVEVTATDDVAMGTLAFTEPPSLLSTQPTTENAGKTLRLKTALDVSALPDGQLNVSVAATDSSSNTATQSITIRVANHGPLISVSGPPSGQSVRGNITISASATGQNGATLTRLTLLNPPPGAGTDSLPAAEALSIAWDTTKAPEGSYVLQFEAQDSFGAVTNVAVPVTVDNIPFGVVTAHVSAGGSPIAGAIVSVYAVDNTTGQPAAAVGANGLLGTCSATDSTGSLACTLTAENYQGPIQVTASGPGLSYLDPTDGVTVVSIPQTFTFSTYIGNYKTGDAISVPLSLWTTLDDAVALAYATGIDRAAAVPHSLTDSLLTIDALFEKHLTSTTWDVRSTIPVSLTSSAQSLRDVVYAAMPDVALNQIARDKSGLANVTPGGVITAVTLVQLLAHDALADGQFDGLATTGQLKTSGNPQQALDASWLRFAMAQALDEWFSGPTNRSGLASSDVQNAGVFDTAAGDTSILFPANVVPQPYDNTPPSVSITATFTNNGTTAGPVANAGQQLVAGALHLAISVSDSSGVQASAVQYRGNGAANWTPMPPAAGSTATQLSGTIDTTALQDGILTIQVLATDKVGNPGTTTIQCVVDNTPPAITVVQPQAPGGYPIAFPAYSSLVPAAINVSDNQTVASVVENALNVTLSNANSSGAWLGSWAIPANQGDGQLSFSYKACDIVFNCRTLVVAFIVDRAPPAVTIAASPARYTNSSTVNIIATAADAASGVASVFAKNLSTNGAPIAGSFDATSRSWSINGMVLKANTDNTIVVFAKDNALDGSGTPLGANTGFGHAQPYQQTIQSLNDTSPPTMVASASQPPSYYDERSMQLLHLGGALNVTSSWAFDPSAASNARAAPLLAVDVSGAAPIHKSLQRIALGTASPNLGDLLASRGSTTNTPYIALNVPFSAATDAPVIGASFSATVTCPGCSPFPAATGSLIQDTINAPDGTRYVLPLSTEFIPPLGQILSAATIVISASAQDAAGNTHALQQVATVQIALDAPPAVAIVRNASYPQSGDPWAVSSCLISNGTYTNCFAPATASMPNEGNRLVQYVVYNLGSRYGLSFQLGADAGDATHASAVVENWEGWNDEPLTPPYTASTPWCTACGSTGCRNEPYASFFWANGSLTCPVDPVLNNPSQTYAPAKQTTAPLAVGVYQANNDGTTIAAPAFVTTKNAFVVPGAAGGFMGIDFIFVGRSPASVARFDLDASPAPASFQWNAAIGKYESRFASVTQPPVFFDRTDCVGTATAACYEDLADWTKRLDFAQSNVYGALNALTASGFVPGTTTALGASTPPTAISLTTTIPQ
jgi:hypothetical protein